MLTLTGPVARNHRTGSQHVVYQKIWCLPFTVVKSLLLQWSWNHHHIHQHLKKGNPSIVFGHSSSLISSLSCIGGVTGTGTGAGGGGQCKVNWLGNNNKGIKSIANQTGYPDKTSGLGSCLFQMCDSQYYNNIPLDGKRSSLANMVDSTTSTGHSIHFHHQCPSDSSSKSQGPSLSDSSSDKLIAKFGVLTDVQYADTDDKPAHYDPSKTRYYRASLNHVIHAFDHWDRETIKPTFVLQFGDIIDGLNKRTNGLDPLDAINKTLAAFEAHPTIPTFHAVGNHELYNFDRAEIISLFRDSLIKRTKIKPDLMGLNFNINDNPVDCSSSSSNCTLYYKFTPSHGLKIIALDCFEISVIGYDPGHPNYRQAEEILYKHHGHRDFDMWDIDDHLPEGPEKRFQQMNGALSEEQLAWLSRELQDSQSKGEKVIVFGHVCLHPGSCDWSCLVWNYDRVIETFHRYNCVISYMSGHAHKFGHSVDEKGIHYIVYHGVIETSPKNEAFATISLYHDRLQVDGYGLEQSLTLSLPSSLSLSSTPSSDFIATSLVEAADTTIKPNDYVSDYSDPVSSTTDSPNTITVTV